MGHNFHSGNSLAPDGAFVCIRSHLARMMAVRGGGIRTANACDPWLCPRTPKEAAALSGADEPVFTARRFGVRLRSHPARAGLLGLILLGWCSPPAVSQSADPSFVTTIRSQSNLPPRVAQAHRFLARRGFASGQPVAARVGARANGFRPRPQAAGAQAAWQPLGPTGVLSSNYGLVTGRISSLALDPADGTGNRLYVGTTRGGVWLSQNAGTANPAKHRGRSQ
jgi:hypothetical protein